ncbi:MAG TPA: pilus assembly protein TadG-related protein [Blastocatellia bacterium]|nr:pilus assembly protein TadG-related protein [Blastocatellia bacterium]
MNRMRRRLIFKRCGERGSILAITVIGMLTFLLAAGLAIDISLLYAVGSELQNAADAAALAGVSALNNTANGITEATNRAVAMMNKREFNGSDVAFRRDDVRFAVNLSDFDCGGMGMSEAEATASPQNIRFVKVTAPPSSVGILFAGLAWASPSNPTTGRSLNLSRSAVAGQSVGVNKVCNFAPIVIIEDNNGNEPLDVVNPASCPNTMQYAPGCVYDLHLGIPFYAQESTYFILNTPTGRCGGNDWKQRIAIGVDGCYSPGDVLATKQFLDAVTIRQGLNTRFNSYVSGITPEDFPPDTNIGAYITYAQYKSGAYSQAPSNPGRPDRRILILPIITKTQFNPWTGAVTLNRFGVFFIQKKAWGFDQYVADLRVEYIGDAVVVGDGSYSPSAGASNSQITVPVLYR